jgi:hypothetical protein
MLWSAVTSASMHSRWGCSTEPRAGPARHGRFWHGPARHSCVRASAHGCCPDWVPGASFPRTPGPVAPIRVSRAQVGLELGRSAARFSGRHTLVLPTRLWAAPRDRRGRRDAASAAAEGWTLGARRARAGACACARRIRAEAWGWHADGDDAAAVHDADLAIRAVGVPVRAGGQALARGGPVDTKAASRGGRTTHAQTTATSALVAGRERFAGLTRALWVRSRIIGGYALTAAGVAAEAIIADRGRVNALSGARGALADRAQIGILADHLLVDATGGRVACINGAQQAVVTVDGGALCRTAGLFASSIVVDRACIAVITEDVARGVASALEITMRQVRGNRIGTDRNGVKVARVPRRDVTDVDLGLRPGDGATHDEPGDGSDNGYTRQYDARSSDLAHERLPSPRSRRRSLPANLHARA